MSLPVIDNATARAIFLERHGLATPRSRSGRGRALEALITRLGFVQVDSVTTLARAHDMILFSRCSDYRPAALRWLNDRARGCFEGWTHDASVIPTAFFPYWRMKFERDREALRARWAKWHGADFHGEIDGVRAHIAEHGPCCSRDLGQNPARKSTGWWDWKPSKAALEYLWRSGELCVTRREGFAKHYDLTERVIPAEFRAANLPDSDVIDWACDAALSRLGFATSGEIAAFFALVTPAEARDWVRAGLAVGRLAEVLIEGADGSLRRAVMRAGEAQTATPPARRLRLLSPFDPALRDRKRAERLFGFHYRIEIFVPEPQRQYGYYVFPVLEGDRLIGRVDLSANRDAGLVHVRALWPEPGIRFGKGRMARLMAEFQRAASFVDCERLEIASDFLRQN